MAFFLFSSAIYGQADTMRIKDLLTVLTKTPKARNYQNIDQLNLCAEFIATNFKEYADTVFYQNYQIGSLTFKNVVARFNPKAAKKWVVGAHYDVCGNQEGADDNASGIVGLLELARLLKGKTLDKCIELVAYTLEEPPFFRTEYMGSFIHAKSLKDSHADVVGMVSLEMIGYFNEAKHTQDYPIGFLKLFYGSRGNYITVVNKFGKGKGPRKFTKSMDRFLRHFP